MNNLNKETNEKKDFIKKSTGNVIISILFILILIIIIYSNMNKVKKVVIIQPLNNIKEPIQISTQGKTTKTIDGINIDITYLATYSLSGRVVDVQKYSQTGINSKLSPLDVGISWGFLAKDENHSKLKWSSRGDRFLSWQTKDINWLNSVGGNSAVQSHYSNNHLIPQDDKINKYFKLIKKDDYIRISGYLVNVYYEKNNGSYYKWNSSTSRGDSGDGACELIYVTDIVWLKE